MNGQTLNPSGPGAAVGAPAMPSTADPTAHAAALAARRCLMAWAVAAALLVVLTFLLRTWPEALALVLGPFDLGQESNLAAWFSASSLLWSGLLMGSSAVLLRGKDAWASAAIAVFGVLAVVLSVDEAGSLHERFDQLVPASLGLSLKKTAAILAVPVLTSVVVLFRRRRVLGGLWALLLGAYVLFGSVFGQEMLEHGVAWRDGLLPLRTAVEEGTEVVGFFLLLLAAVRLRGRCRVIVAGSDATPSPPLGWVLPERGVLLLAWVAAALVAPLLVLWAVSIPFEELRLYHRGDFGSTLMMAMFLITGGLCFRRAMADGPSRRGWPWLGAACILLSLLHNWHVYSAVQAVLHWDEPLPLWRVCYDLCWALPVFAVVTLLVRRQTGMAWWVAAVWVLLWLVALVAAERATYKMSYAASYLSAVAIGGWVIYATRCRPRGGTPDD